jgi:hypothetical protein
VPVEQPSPESRLPAAFQPRPATPPALPGTPENPFKPLNELPVPAVTQAIKELGLQAPLPALTERANNIAASSEWPPPAPQIKGQKVAITPEDALETKSIQEQVRDAASAEDIARLREVYGQNRLGSDVSTPKGRLTGVMGEGNDVYMRDRSTDATPDVTALTKDVQSPDQAVRQVQLMTKAGASKAAIDNFKMRAAVKFGPDWMKPSSDDLTPILQQSLDQARARKVAQP